MYKRRTAIILLLLFFSYGCFAQETADEPVSQVKIPCSFIGKLNRKTAGLNDQLVRQTDQYLAKMAKREDRLRQHLSKRDPAAAHRLFPDSSTNYAAFVSHLKKDTGSASAGQKGEYHANTDSLQTLLKYLNTSTGGLDASKFPVRTSLQQFQQLQSRLESADEIKAYIHQRRQLISDYIQQHSNMAGILGKDFKAYNEQAYYYAQQIREYRETLNDPDKLTQKALQVLNKVPAFQDFMKRNSLLAGVFNLPDNYASAETLNGLQTRDQVAAIIQQQVTAAGPGGAATLNANLQAGQSQLQDYKDKLSKLGNGSGDIDMPDFKPNQQKTKTFWRRLEYGTNLQTSRNNVYFPTVADVGLSVGYKLNDNNIIGLGASYKLGLGNGWQHIAFSNQGVGLRSFLDIRIKGSLSASGGFELNHTTPFSDYQQLKVWDVWTKSGLIGATKVVSMKSRFFKKTKLQLLWDFLSYQQIPKTQAFLFRVGYAW